MKTINHLILIKTLTDYHLESYTRSPNQFYRQYVLKIIMAYYRLPVCDQNQLNLLKLLYLDYVKCHIENPNHLLN